MNKVSKVAAVTPTNEEDALRWGSQYLGEVERLGLYFAMHFDRCSASTKSRFLNHYLCVGSTANDEPKREYRESDRQGPFDLLVRTNRFNLVLLLDMDETYERDAIQKINEMATRPEVGCFRVIWRNLWEDEHHYREDNPSNPYRVKANRIDGGRRWSWEDPITVDPRPGGMGSHEIGDTDLVCYNHGAMTHELRLLHAERWDRVYGRYREKNPYGYWHYLLDYEKHPPVVVPRDDLP